MASAAEQLASNLSLDTLSKATELKKRIWFTLGALLVYRVGSYIPVPGVDAAVMGEMLAQHGGGILGMFDMFSGGSLGRMTVFALAIMPYISASIIIQLMTTAVPQLESLKKEGETGRKGLNQYTRYLTVIIAMIQSYGIAVGLEGLRGAFGPAVIRWPDVELRITADASARTVVVHTPPEGICVEHQTMWPNAPLLAAAGVADTGMRTLEPGQTLSARAEWAWTA